jgi:hypothetical protein
VINATLSSSAIAALLSPVFVHAETAPDAGEKSEILFCGSRAVGDGSVSRAVTQDVAANLPVYNLFAS